MAVAQSYESIADRSASGVIRESPTYRRSFIVRVDHPATSLKEVGAAPGINYGDIATHEEAELFGATLLGLDQEHYYATLCKLADSLPAAASCPT